MHSVDFDKPYKTVVKHRGYLILACVTASWVSPSPLPPTESDSDGDNIEIIHHEVYKDTEAGPLEPVHYGIQFAVHRTLESWVEELKGMVGDDGVFRYRFSFNSIEELEEHVLREQAEKERAARIEFHEGSIGLVTRRP